MILFKTVRKYHKLPINNIDENCLSIVQCISWQDYIYYKIVLNIFASISLIYNMHFLCCYSYCPQCWISTCQKILYFLDMWCFKPMAVDVVIVILQGQVKRAFPYCNSTSWPLSSGYNCYVYNVCNWQHCHFKEM